MLLHRELDHALGLTDMAASLIGDPRTGKNGRHRLAGFLRQSVFSRLAGYEDVNDADRQCHDPVIRQLVGGRAIKNGAASAGTMGRFETEMLTSDENLGALTYLLGRCIDAVHDRHSKRTAVNKKLGEPFRVPLPYQRVFQMGNAGLVKNWWKSGCQSIHRLADSLGIHT